MIVRYKDFNNDEIFVEALSVKIKEESAHIITILNSKIHVESGNFCIYVPTNVVTVDLGKMRNDNGTYDGSTD